jgi:hypothetical protein
MKNLYACTAYAACAASLGLALSAHAVQSTSTTIGQVVKPTALVVKPTSVSSGKAQAAAVTGPKVRPAAVSAAPAKTGR